MAIPLLLAAYKLDHVRFSGIVQAIEKTFFRYKLVCNQHVSKLKKIYSEETISIRSDPQNYDTTSLNRKLKKLIDENANDEYFESSLNTLEYKKGGGNKPLKYFLMCCEYYYEWYKAGAEKEPLCVDKSRVYDFSGTSIEHVYPRNADQKTIDNSLEPVKNDLGNLTIMDPAQNSLAGNDGFESKVPIYLRSSVVLTREIGERTAWTRKEFDQHKENLKSIALNVFKILA